MVPGAVVSISLDWEVYGFFSTSCFIPVTEGGLLPLNILVLPHVLWKWWFLWPTRTSACSALSSLRCCQGRASLMWLSRFLWFWIAPRSTGSTGRVRLQCFTLVWSVLDAQSLPKTLFRLLCASDFTESWSSTPQSTSSW